MSVRRLDPVQPEDFSFSAENDNWADAQIAKYPEGKQASAVIPLLWKAQEQAGGWLPEPAIRHVAERLDMAQIRVLEVATFYTMFNLSPVGKYFIQLCGTTPCMLRGSDEIIAVCKEVIGPQQRVTEDGLFSWLEVECLGACCNAPMVQINKYFYEDLTGESFRKLLNDLKAGKEIAPGSLNGRQGSCPTGGATTLIEVSKVEVPEDLAAFLAKRAGASGVIDAGGSPVAEIVSEDETVKDGEASDAVKPLGLVRPDSDVDEEIATDSLSETEEEGEKPPVLSAPRDGVADDLKRISGVGPKLEGTLNELGIYHFDQIASWSRDHIVWVDGYLSFKGRIDRENWIEQAKTLASGGTTDFASRYDDGEEGDA